MTGKLRNGLDLRADLGFPHKVIKSLKSLGVLCVNNGFIYLPPAGTGHSCGRILFQRRNWGFSPFSRQQMILYLLFFLHFFSNFSPFFPPFPVAAAAGSGCSLSISLHTNFPGKLFMVRGKKKSQFWTKNLAVEPHSN